LTAAVCLVHWGKRRSRRSATPPAPTGPGRFRRRPSSSRAQRGHEMRPRCTRLRFGFRSPFVRDVANGLVVEVLENRGVTAVWKASWDSHDSIDRVQNSSGAFDIMGPHHHSIASTEDAEPLVKALDSRYMALGRRRGRGGVAILVVRSIRCWSGLGVKSLPSSIRPIQFRVRWDISMRLIDGPRQMPDTSSQRLPVSTNKGERTREKDKKSSITVSGGSFVAANW
jgi:hypothetical protein